MTRVKLILTIDAAAGSVTRMLDWLREGGYTVGELQTVPGTGRINVEVQAPHGEVDARPQWLGRRLTSTR